jgi:hypothetical protein
MEGNDELLGNGGTDTAYFFGLRSSYLIVTHDGEVSVVDTQAATDGDDGTDVISSIERLSFKGGETANVVSPIILDLDGNGANTVSAADSNARYDLDGDGLADDTSWIGSTEGLLFLDRDGNGTVTNACEFSFIDDLPGASSDLEGLRSFDSNKDGILSSVDAKFAEFKVWQDRDGDGAAEATEILTFTQAGVRSINLAGTAVNSSTQLGEVAVISKGTYTRANGSTMEFLDAALTYFSSATNLPTIAVQSESYGGNSKQYRIKVSGGAMVVTANKSKNALDPRAGALGASSILSFKNQTIGMLSPIILDLDGDGVEILSIKKAKSSFDMNGDGIADDTGWTGKGDGFLVIDRNNDGKITEASELSFAAEDKNSRNDLEALAALDNNGDRVLNKDDARFGELKVWADANGNGATDTGELKTLSELGITEIGLVGRNIDSTVKVGDNVVISTSTFTRSNGSVGTAGNVALAYRPGDANVTVDFGGDADNGLSAMERAVAILRGAKAGGLSLLPQFGVLENGRDIVNIFDYYEQPDEGSAGGAVSGNEPTTLRLADPVDAPLMTQDLLSSMQLAGVENGIRGVQDVSDPSARLLALIAQDMAAFGARNGEIKPSWRGDDIRPVEYFA